MSIRHGALIFTFYVYVVCDFHSHIISSNALEYIAAAQHRKSVHKIMQFSSIFTHIEINCITRTYVNLDFGKLVLNFIALLSFPVA